MREGDFLKGGRGGRRNKGGEGGRRAPVRWTRRTFFGARLRKSSDMWSCLNCSHVRSENSLWPSSYDEPLPLCSLMIASFEANAASADASASDDAYVLAWVSFHSLNLVTRSEPWKAKAAEAIESIVVCCLRKTRKRALANRHAQLSVIFGWEG